MAAPEHMERCDHICLKDARHIEYGEPHFYGYENPSPRRRSDGLFPVENAALSIALAQIRRGDEVPPNTTAVLIFALERLTTARRRSPS